MINAIPPPTRRQALEQVRRSPGFPGICRICGCTENNACVNMFDEPCGWADRSRTLCNTLECLNEAARRRQDDPLNMTGNAPPKPAKRKPKVHA